mmetsp:Transcript_22561/g.49059  ORF Transcript_22561/g.49059 Transcript_22561/m.49059 type:complete len:214 (-) Transcript_22561:1065-1706(-)
MKPKADPVTAGGDVTAGADSDVLGSFAPFKDKLSNILAAAATGAVGVGAGGSEFMNPKADAFGAAASPDIKSSKLTSAAGAGGAATGGAATGSTAGADTTFKPPNKFPPPIAVCGGFGGDCWGGGGGAAGAGAGVTGSPLSKSNRLATGAGGATAGGAATGAAACLTGGITVTPTAVATPNKFKTRFAGSRMAARLWLARGANSPLHACRKSA